MTRFARTFLPRRLALGLFTFSVLAAGSRPASAQDVTLDASTGTPHGKWAVLSDSTAVGGRVMRHPDAGAAKRTTALASPADYFELTFQAQANTAYRIWIHGKADRNYWGNDSVFVQFSGSVTSSGSATYRIGTTSATEMNLEECEGCGLSGWDWQDNGWGKGVLGPKLYFATTGTQTIRIQTREDGLSIDRIILSPSAYLTTEPPPIGGSGSSSTTATDVALTASSVTTRAGKWALQSDSTAVGGTVIRHPDAGAAKRTTALASPSDYFEASFQAVANTPYRLWIHGKADRDYWGNDSVFVQFSGSVTSSGSSIYRIGTTSATEMNLEECDGCGLSGWDWQDNGWGKGVLGPVVYFAATGTQKIRIQTREDGLAIDRILLSPSTYLKTEPPASGGSSGSSTTATDVTLDASKITTRAGKWALQSYSGAINGTVIRHPDAGAAKVKTALASPSNYFEATFQAVANTPYRLWIHGIADRDYWGNDSVFVQFSGSVTSSGSAIYRIGTTSATEMNLEECDGCGLSGWDWQDNGWGNGVLGPVIYFATTGTQKIRVQTREDGLAIDRLVLSPSTYLKTSPPATGTSTPPADESADDGGTSSTSGSTLLKVFDWNIHHGVGTDGVYNLDRIAKVIAGSGANVVSLNEVEKYTSWGNEDQPARFASLLKSKTGKTWYYKFAHRTGGTNGQGNLILSTFKFESTGSYLLSYSRSVARVAIIVNGIRVNVFSTHLDADSSSRRATQMKELKSWAATYPEQRIPAGDFNAWPGASEITNMTSAYYDAWAEAVADNTDVAYSGNTAGNTRNSRIDYVWFSKGATRLHLRQARVFDVRDSNGVMPSDHRPVMATFEVK